MTTQFKLCNAHCMEKTDQLPSKCKRETVLTVPKDIEDYKICPMNNGQTIPAGKYVVVDRKHFVAGFQIVEAV